MIRPELRSGQTRPWPPGRIQRAGGDAGAEPAVAALTRQIRYIIGDQQRASLVASRARWDGREDPMLFLSGGALLAVAVAVTDP
ncbi:MAG: hypothetical protein ACREXS_08745 [Gammaproteobacteria bacterium]